MEGLNEGYTRVSIEVSYPPRSLQSQTTPPIQEVMDSTSLQELVTANRQHSTTGCTMLTMTESNMNNPAIRSCAVGLSCIDHCSPASEEETTNTVHLYDTLCCEMMIGRKLSPTTSDVSIQSCAVGSSCTTPCR